MDNIPLDFQVKNDYETRREENRVLSFVNIFLLFSLSAILHFNRTYTIWKVAASYGMEHPAVHKLLVFLRENIFTSQTAAIYLARLKKRIFSSLQACLMLLKFKIKILLSLLHFLMYGGS